MKLDLGCGKNKCAPDFVGVDSIAFPGVDQVVNLVASSTINTLPEGQMVLFRPWPWESDSVDEVYSSHTVEHFTNGQRVHFWNELYRVLKPGGTARIIVPNWSHACAYGDPTHQWPPMSEWAVLYLNKAWRDVNAPHVALTCDFDYGTAGSWDQWLEARNQETKTFAMLRYVNSHRDLIFNLTKTVRK